MDQRIGTQGHKAFINCITQNYDIKNTLDIQKTLKNMFSEMMEAMLEAELDQYLGYSKSDNQAIKNSNRRNGYTPKKARSQLGELEIKVPRDRESSFEPKILPKRKKDIMGIDAKILSMYAKGQSLRDIKKIISEIYGFNISHETISKITNKVIPLVEKFRSRALKACYPFVYVDAMYVPVKTSSYAGKKPLYTMIGIDLEGHKEVIGFWLSEKENKDHWIQIFSEIKDRGVEDIFFVSLDGLTGLQQAINAVYPLAKTQRCIVHLMRNSMNYLPCKEWGAFATDIKSVYRSAGSDESKMLFERFEQKWADYPSAVGVWKRNWKAIENLYQYPEEIRKVIYTTNIIESYHNQLRKVTNRKGSFSNEISLYKLIYLRTMEIQEGWKTPIPNWSEVLKQLKTLFRDRIRKFIE